jgi:uncharacterized membrane protein HdeD (DUF308 family)
MATTALDDVRRAYRGAWWALVLRGLLSVAIGIFVFVRPLESIAAFALLIAWWALFSGAVEIMHGIEMRAVMRHWWVMLLGGLVSVVFGIASLIYYPVLSLTFAVVWAAWWLTITGVLGLYVGMRQKQLGLPWGWTIAFAILSVAAGLFALLAPPVTLAAIMGLIAGFAMISGVALLVAAFTMRSKVHV